VHTISFYSIQKPVEAAAFKYEMWNQLSDVSVPYNITVPREPDRKHTASAEPEPVRPAAAETSSPVTTAEQPEAEVEAAQQTEEPAKAERAVDGDAWPPLKLTGIMASGKNSTAIINEEFVSVGDLISDVTVESITADTVTLKYRNKTATLRIGDSLP